MIVLLLLLLVAVDGADRRPSTTTDDPLMMHWKHSLFLDAPHNRYHLLWTPRSEDIVFRVEVRTRGYVGFGLSRNGRMTNSDIVVGWVQDGKATVQDRHAVSRSEPVMDKMQDWRLLFGTENETHTILVFQRHYDTCDRYDLKITNDTWRVIYAFHESDPVNDSILHHGRQQRGSKSLLLTQHASWPLMTTNDFPWADHDLFTWDLQNDQVTLPEDDDTLYWCKLFKLPDRIKSKHHLIGYKPIIQPGNEGYFHHLLLYECKSTNVVEEEEFEQVVLASGHFCYEPKISSVLKSCNKLIGVWAIGAEGFYMPNDVGYPLDPNSGVRYLKMEVHYDNPYLQDGIKDSSGIRLYYTSKLRDIDAGVLSVGIEPNWKHLIPPKQSATVSYGHCVSECTNKSLPPEGISVFAAVLHSHLLGRKIQLRHFRGDSEMPPITVDNNYDFEYQEYRVFEAPVKIMPGDYLMVECVYNSRGRDRMTQGGFTTREEMCLVFIYYYPKIDMSLCHSIPTLSTVHQSVGVTEVWSGRIPAIIKSPVMYANRSLAEHFSKYNWSKNMKLYNEVIRTGAFEVSCGRHGQTLLPSEVHYYPNFTRTYSDPRSSCTTGKHVVSDGPPENGTAKPHAVDEGTNKSAHADVINTKKPPKGRKEKSSTTEVESVSFTTQSGRLDRNWNRSAASLERALHIGNLLIGISLHLFLKI